MARVVWSTRAGDDLHGVFEHLSDRSPTNAEKVVLDIINKVFLLEQFPKMGRVVPELNIVYVRELILHQYRVIYSVVQEDRVEILAVRHSSKDISSL